MTIAFIKNWNAYEAGETAALSATVEADLVALGFAIRMEDLARLSTDASGNTVLVSVDGVEHPVGICIAVVGIATDFAVPINNGANKVAWDGGLVINTTGSSTVWTAGAPSKLVVPAGFKKARATSQIRLDDAFAGMNYTNHISIDGLLTYDGVGLEAGERNVDGALIIQAQTAWVEVTAGQYFETFTMNGSATTQNWILGTVRSWFQLELMR